MFNQIILSMKRTSMIVLGICAVIVALSGCKDKEVAKVLIKYEVIATTTARPMTIYTTNILGGEDVVHDTATLRWVQAFEISSDTTKQEYSLRVFCDELYTNNVSQTITTNIYEDGKLISTDTYGGTSTIWSSDTKVLADLPTSIKYVD